MAQIYRPCCGPSAPRYARQYASVVAPVRLVNSPATTVHVGHSWRSTL